MRLCTGTGGKGVRHYDWAMLAITSDDAPDDAQDFGATQERSVLLVRRHRYIGSVSLYRCWSPRPVPVATLIHVATAWWCIEEDHQLAKQSFDLDTGQVTRWRSWHRWSAMSLPAYLFLAVATALQRRHDRPPPRRTPS